MEATRLDGVVPKLKAILTGMVGEEGMTRLCTLLKETGSLIAGGSVLRAYQQSAGQEEVTTGSDIDIYVPIQHILAFNRTLAGDTETSILGPFAGGRVSSSSSYSSSLYCSSFLQKNGIKKVYRYRLKSNREMRRRELPTEIDIMIVRNRRTPLQVVNNFDLTFCQIWFDGEHVYASHPADIQNKKGTLQGEYVNLFLEGNAFLQKRLQKYGRRGYSIFLDQAYISQDLVSLFLNKNSCLRIPDEQKYLHWASRVLLVWMLGRRDTFTHHEHSLTPSIDHTNILFVPLKRYSIRVLTTARDTYGNIRYGNNEPEDDDGYDSEEYGEHDSLYQISYERYERKPSELATVEDSPAFKQLIYHRNANTLLEVARWPNIYKDNTSYAGKRSKSLGYLLEQYSNPTFELFWKALQSRCLRKGTSFLTQEDDVVVYDLHEHPVEAAISADDLEGYLSHHITDADKSAVPCYYKPNPGNPASNCNHGITLSQVKYIVSKEFYDKYSAPPPTKLGLDQFMTHYDQTLQNAKEHTPGWGELYHHTVCPYCLQFESRDSGCAYMTHENSKRLPSSSSPFCDERFQIQALVERYKAVSENGDAAHCEFCAECGRPCVDHAHISSVAPYTKIDAPIVTRADGRREHDYVSCLGGGRAELFARILAIRKVYRDGGFTNPKEERVAAAMAADNAPNDPDLMAQGAAILAQEEATRHWTNAPIPPTKQYDDPAYAVAEEHEEEQEGGDYKRKYGNTRKRNNKVSWKHIRIRGKSLRKRSGRKRSGQRRSDRKLDAV